MPEPDTLRLGSIAAAKHFGVSPTTLRKWLREYEIPIRGRGSQRDPRKPVIQPRKTYPSPPREELVRVYVEQRQGAKRVGDTFGVSGALVIKWLNAYGIPVRRRGLVPEEEDTRIAAAFWGSIKGSARVRAIPFRITVREAADLFARQNGRCALSGEAITMPRSPGEYREAKHTASLDRIDSSADYAIDNVQWVHKDLNTMKMDFTAEEFVGWCAKVYRHHRGDALDP